MTRALEVIINIVFPIFYVIWRIFAFIFLLVWKVLTDLFKNVYGRVIVAVGAIIFAYLVYIFTDGHF
jgi:hypothetical protein